MQRRSNKVFDGKRLRAKPVKRKVIDFNNNLLLYAEVKKK